VTIERDMTDEEQAALDARDEWKAYVVSKQQASFLGPEAEEEADAAERRAWERWSELAATNSMCQECGVKLEPDWAWAYCYNDSPQDTKMEWDAYIEAGRKWPNV
jgi:hypothetical protein